MIDLSLSFSFDNHLFIFFEISTPVDFLSFIHSIYSTVMHWISLITFCMIINLCQSQPTGFQPFETANSNKDNSFHIGTNGIHGSLSESKNDVGHFAYTTTQSIASESTTKQGRIALKSVTNSSDNHRCYFMFPFLLATLIMIIRF